MPPGSDVAEEVVMPGPLVCSTAFLAFRRRRVACALLIGSAVTVPLLTGCAGGGGSPSPITSGPAGTAVRRASAVPHDAGTEPGDRAAVTAVPEAVAVLRLFCRPAVPAVRWVAELGPRLTAGAAAAYSTVDPARVRCRSITAGGHSKAGDERTQLVVVPTDGGNYQVTVTRTSPAAVWRVSDIAPVAAR